MAITISNGAPHHLDPKALRNAFADNLRRLRHERGFSQEDLAYTAGVNRTYVSKLEKAVSYPGLEIIARLATVLEVDPANLLGVGASLRHGYAAAAGRRLILRSTADRYPEVLNRRRRKTRK